MRQIFTLWNPRHNNLQVVWRPIRSRNVLQAMKSCCLGQSYQQCDAIAPGWSRAYEIDINRGNGPFFENATDMDYA